MHGHEQNDGRQLQLRSPNRRDQQEAAGDADTTGTRSEIAHAVDLVHGQRERFCDGFDGFEQGAQADDQKDRAVDAEEQRQACHRDVPELA